MNLQKIINCLGQFRLEGIPAAPRGVPQIEVTFDIDANGIVNVSAKDKATGKEQKITITSSSGLSKEEVESMVKEAAAHEAEDQKAREAVEKKNRLDGLIHDIEKTLNENKEKLPQEDVDNDRKQLLKKQKLPWQNMQLMLKSFKKQPMNCLRLPIK